MQEENIKTPVPTDVGKFFDRLRKIAKPVAEMPNTYTFEDALLADIEFLEKGLRFWEEEKKIIYIRRIFVLDHLRGRGIAKRFVSALVDFAEEESVVLFAIAGGFGFWTPEHPIYRDAGMRIWCYPETLDELKRVWIEDLEPDRRIEKDRLINFYRRFGFKRFASGFQPAIRFYPEHNWNNPSVLFVPSGIPAPAEIRRRLEGAAARSSNLPELGSKTG